MEKNRRDKKSERRSKILVEVIVRWAIPKNVDLLNTQRYTDCNVHDSMIPTSVYRPPDVISSVERAQ